jgi:hypothetical protein
VYLDCRAGVPLRMARREKGGRIELQPDMSAGIVGDRSAVVINAFDTGPQPLDPGTAVVRSAHVASSGSTRGLNVLNFGPLTSGQTIEAEIVDCHFFDNVFNLSEGVRMGNVQGARFSTVNVRMLGNTSWGQKQGRLTVNNRALDSTVNVVSSGNRFYDNGARTIERADVRLRRRSVRRTTAAHRPLCRVAGAFRGLRGSAA